MQQKSVLITGCSSGIGHDAAKGLKSRGWRVFATCRAEADCARLRKDGFESFPLDYSNEASISDAVSQVLTATDGTLDALFNNGAYGFPCATEDLTRDALRDIFETNLFGYHDLSRRLIPAMRAQGHGRIVNCSSILGLVVLRWRGAYTATKFAMEGLTDTMRIELRGSGISVSLIEPGPITSMLRQKARPQFERWVDWENSVHTAKYQSLVIPRLYDDSAKPDPFERPPSHVTRKLVHALESKRPRPRYFVTAPTHVFGTLRRVLPTRALDWIVARG